MKILSRYILREFLGNLLLGLIIFTFVLLLDHLFELANLLLNKGVGIWLTLELLFLLLPSSLTLTLPMSTLLGALLTFGRLSENNEITAVRASGLPASQYARTPIIAALIASLFLIPFNTMWAPHAHAAFRKLYVEVLKRNPLIRIEEKTFAEIGEYHLFVERKDRKGTMSGITIYKLPATGAPLRIFADRGTASVDTSRGITFFLNNGRIEKVDAKDPSKWLYTAFKEYQFFIPLVSEQGSGERALEEMDNRDLRREMTRLKSKGLPSPLLACQMHLRWALAFAPFLFAILGIPLAIKVQRGGRSIGFGLSLLVMVMYYVLVMGGMAAGQRGLWPPWFAVWIGNAVLLVSAVFFYWRFVRR